MAKKRAFKIINEIFDFKKFKRQGKTKTIIGNEQKEKVCDCDKVKGYYFITEEKWNEIFNIKE